MSETKLFGTDGVRGKAGEYPLDHPTVARLGAALVHAMKPSVTQREGARPLRFVVGRDTRESGGWIEEELARGAGSEGASVTSAGVIPTPAIAYVTPAMAFDAGIVTAIVGGWNLTASVGHRYDSNPPANIKKGDLIIFTGLQYGWGPK